MLEVEDKPMDKLRKSLGKVLVFYPQSTASLKYLTNQVFFIRRFDTSFSQLKIVFTQPQSWVFNPLSLVLCPLFTGPITNTKLIKE
jgi:hypothetical protein